MVISGASFWSSLCNPRVSNQDEYVPPWRHPLEVQVIDAPTVKLGDWEVLFTGSSPFHSNLTLAAKDGAFWMSSGVAKGAARDTSSLLGFWSGFGTPILADWYNEVAEIFLQHLSLNGNGRILNLGVGVGALAGHVFCQDNQKLVSEVLSIDVDPTVVKLVQTHIAPIMFEPQQCARGQTRAHYAVANAFEIDKAVNPPFSCILIDFFYYTYLANASFWRRLRNISLDSTLIMINTHYPTNLQYRDLIYDLDTAGWKPSISSVFCLRNGVYGCRLLVSASLQKEGRAGPGH